MWGSHRQRPKSGTGTGRCKTTWDARRDRRSSSHVARWLRRESLAPVQFGHPPHASASKSRILVAVPPAVDGSLNESTFPSQRGIQIRKSPTDGVALRLINKSIAFVLVLAAASPRIDTVFCLELLAKIVHIDGFDVTTNSIFHLHTISRILKRDPLYSVAILSHYERSCRWNWARCCAGACTDAWSCMVNTIGGKGTTSRCRMRWAQHCSLRWSRLRRCDGNRTGCHSNRWCLGRLVR
jgi:hypothetical protein